MNNCRIALFPFQRCRWAERKITKISCGTNNKLYTWGLKVATLEKESQFLRASLVLGEVDSAQEKLPVRCSDQSQLVGLGESQL